MKERRIDRAPAGETRIIETRGEFADAIRTALAGAADRRCREIRIADTDFADWPLGERGVIDNLTRWAFASRKLRVLAQSFDAIVRLHPRFVEWRRSWSHIVECRQLDEAESTPLPALLVASGFIVVRLFDKAAMRGSVSTERSAQIECLEHLDAISQRSTEAFGATKLGL